MHRSDSYVGQPDAFSALAAALRGLRVDPQGHFPIGRHLKKVNDDQLQRGAREEYGVGHWERLVRYQPRRRFTRSTGPPVYCKTAHGAGCKICQTCHFCRQKTIDQKTSCSCASWGGRRGVWCGRCLDLRMGENILEVLENAAWKCPACRQLCNCSNPTCQRIGNNLEPTNQLSSEAADLGYPSVAHYLVLTHLTAKPSVADVEAVLRQAAAAGAAAGPSPPSLIAGQGRRGPAAVLSRLQQLERDLPAADLRPSTLASASGLASGSGAPLAAPLVLGAGILELDNEEDEQDSSPAPAAARPAELVRTLASLAVQRSATAQRAGPTASSGPGGDGAAAWTIAAGQARHSAAAGAVGPAAQQLSSPWPHAAATAGAGPSGGSHPSVAADHSAGSWAAQGQVTASGVPHLHGPRAALSAAQQAVPLAAIHAAASYGDDDEDMHVHFGLPGAGTGAAGGSSKDAVMFETAGWRGQARPEMAASRPRTPHEQRAAPEMVRENQLRGQPPHPAAAAWAAGPRPASSLARPAWAEAGDAGAPAGSCASAAMDIDVSATSEHCDASFPVPMDTTDYAWMEDAAVSAAPEVPAAPTGCSNLEQDPVLADMAHHLASQPPLGRLAADDHTPEAPTAALPVSNPGYRPAPLPAAPSSCRGVASELCIVARLVAERLAQSPAEREFAGAAVDQLLTHLPRPGLPCGLSEFAQGPRPPPELLGGADELRDIATLLQVAASISLDAGDWRHAVAAVQLLMGSCTLAGDEPGGGRPSGLRHFLSFSGGDHTARAIALRGVLGVLSAAQGQRDVVHAALNGLCSALKIVSKELEALDTLLRHSRGTAQVVRWGAASDAVDRDDERGVLLTIRGLEDGPLRWRGGSGSGDCLGLGVPESVWGQAELLAECDAGLLRHLMLNIQAQLPGVGTSVLFLLGPELLALLDPKRSVAHEVRAAALDVLHHCLLLLARPGVPELPQEDVAKLPGLCLEAAAHLEALVAIEYPLRRPCGPRDTLQSAADGSSRVGSSAVAVLAVAYLAQLARCGLTWAQLEQKLLHPFPTSFWELSHSDPLRRMVLYALGHAVTVLPHAISTAGKEAVGMLLRHWLRLVVDHSGRHTLAFTTAVLAQHPTLQGLLGRVGEQVISQLEQDVSGSCRATVVAELLRAMRADATWCELIPELLLHEPLHKVIAARGHELLSRQGGHTAAVHRWEAATCAVLCALLRELSLEQQGTLPTKVRAALLPEKPVGKVMASVLDAMAGWTATAAALCMTGTGVGEQDEQGDPADAAGSGPSQRILACSSLSHLSSVLHVVVQHTALLAGQSTVFPAATAGGALDRLLLSFLLLEGAEERRGPLLDLLAGCLLERCVEPEGEGLLRRMTAMHVLWAARLAREPGDEVTPALNALHLLRLLAERSAEPAQLCALLLELLPRSLVELLTTVVSPEGQGPGARGLRAQAYRLLARLLKVAALGGLLPAPLPTEGQGTQLAALRLLTRLVLAAVLADVETLLVAPVPAAPGQQQLVGAGICPLDAAAVSQMRMEVLQLLGQPPAYRGLSNVADCLTRERSRLPSHPVPAAPAPLPAGHCAREGLRLLRELALSESCGAQWVALAMPWLSRLLQQPGRPAERAALLPIYQHILTALSEQQLIQPDWELAASTAPPTSQPPTQQQPILPGGQRTSQEDRGTALPLAPSTANQAVNPGSGPPKPRSLVAGTFISSGWLGGGTKACRLELRGQGGTKLVIVASGKALVDSLFRSVAQHEHAAHPGSTSVWVVTEVEGMAGAAGKDNRSVLKLTSDSQVLLDPDLAIVAQMRQGPAAPAQPAHRADALQATQGVLPDGNLPYDSQAATQAYTAPSHHSFLMSTSQQRS